MAQILFKPYAHLCNLISAWVVHSLNSSINTIPTIYIKPGFGFSACWFESKLADNFVRQGFSWCSLLIWAMTWQNQQNECAPIEDSDQPGHPPSLIRVFAVCMKNLVPLTTHWAYSEDSDKTRQMPRLIWVYAGRMLIMLVLSCCGSYQFTSVKRSIVLHLVKKQQWICLRTKW